jgi:hypothetical protein
MTQARFEQDRIRLFGARRDDGRIGLLSASRG